jgi:putative endonuclease
MTALTGDAKGRRAERLAAWFLALKGYRVITRRARTGVGEIDLIALKGDIVAFIEVKYRPDARTALDSIGARQQRRIAAAARAFLAHNPQWAEKTLRFDVVLMTPGRWPNHILNAWAGSEHNAH